jgi:mitochondrial chaperone BCS1
MNDVPENSLILFEDIDCMKAGNRRDDPSESRKKQHSAAGTEKSDVADRFGVTLSGLLNVLDGVHAPENVVYVMTTNKVEALDPAFLRPGRIDYRLFMGEREFAQAHRAETMAEFQGLLLALEQGWETLEPLLREFDRVGVSF